MKDYQLLVVNTDRSHNDIFSVPYRENTSNLGEQQYQKSLKAVTKCKIQ